jgi:hypothetical protein
MFRPRWFLVAISGLAFGMPAADAPALTHTWSGPASPCGSTLQNCINASSPGDVVEVATNVPINEDLTIAKSLTLTAAPGFSPSLSPLHFVLLSNPNPLANSIRFEHFTIARGFVQAVQLSSNTFDLGIQFLTIPNTFNAHAPIEVRTQFPGSFGPMQVGIVGNHLTIPPASQSNGTGGISLQGSQASSLTGLISRNVVNVFQGGQEPAIGVYNVDATLDVTVVGNEIRGSDFNDGVLFFQFGNGTSQVRVLDNLVVGQTTDSGVPAAYAMILDGGNTTFEIVNNTADDGDYGILITGRDDKGAGWNGIVANNIVANMTTLGIGIDQPTESFGVVDNDHNLTFNVPFNSFVPGPGTLSADPLFFGGGNYRLTDESPARNAGNDARVPFDLTTDLDGNPRIVHVVDLGAYESSSLVAAEPATAEAFHLESNSPNPFHAATAIRYALPRAGRVWLGIYDARGRFVRGLVAGQHVAQGPQTAQWDGRDASARAMPAGVYYYRLGFEGRTLTRRMVLLP